jgi:hypothetical protein
MKCSANHAITIQKFVTIWISQNYNENHVNQNDPNKFLNLCYKKQNG